MSFPPSNGGGGLTLLELMSCFLSCSSCVFLSVNACWNIAMDDSYWLSLLIKEFTAEVNSIAQ
jgi:hypothetical protein